MISDEFSFLDWSSIVASLLVKMIKIGFLLSPRGMHNILIEIFLAVIHERPVGHLDLI